MSPLGKAQRKLADIISRRPHSKRELKTKLRRFFTEDIVSEALVWAEDCDLLESEETLSSKVTEELLRKGKGSFYIKGYLRKKGLPQHGIDAQSELEFATQTINKLMKGRERDYSSEENNRLARYLTNRGFKSDVIREIIFKRT